MAQYTRKQMAKMAEHIMTCIPTVFNNQDVRTLPKLHAAITDAQQQGTYKAICQFATDNSYGMQPHEGVPQLYFDQLNVIAGHLKAIKKEQDELQSSDLNHILLTNYLQMQLTSHANSLYHN